MIASSLDRLLRQMPETALVLDVGGWGKPLKRADVVIDHMPYESRGLYGADGEGDERFTADSWIIWDICERRPWPFADKSFDFVCALRRSRTFGIRCGSVRSWCGRPRQGTSRYRHGLKNSHTASRDPGSGGAITVGWSTLLRGGSSSSSSTT